MDLARLRAFVAVAQELHFGRAALLLGLSQPQVSRQVRTLEDELGVALFVRTARHTELTDEGRALLTDARDAITAADRIAERARLARRRVGGRVAVAFLQSTLGVHLPALVAAAGERHPQIELTVSQIAFLEILPSLRRGDVDLVVGRSTCERSEMVETTLRWEPAMVALPAAHPLAERDRLPTDVIYSEPLIALNRALVPGPYDAQIEAARASGHEPRIVQHVRSVSEALALVAAGVGLYRLPRSAASPHPGIVYRELVDSPIRLVLIHLPEPARAVRAVAAVAAERFGDARSASKDSPAALEGTATAP